MIFGPVSSILNKQVRNVVFQWLLNVSGLPPKSWGLLNFSLCSFTNWVINQGFWITENLHYSVFTRSHTDKTRDNRYKLFQDWFCLDIRLFFFFSSGNNWSLKQPPQWCCAVPTTGGFRPVTGQGARQSQPGSFFPWKAAPDVLSRSLPTWASMILLKPWAYSANFSLKVKITSRAAFLKPKEQMNVKNILQKTH